MRNLRAAGRATITIRRRNLEVTAVEMEPGDRVAFFRDVLAPLVRQYGKLVLGIVRNIDRIDIDNPVESAVGRPVFELYPADGLSTQ